MVFHKIIGRPTLKYTRGLRCEKPAKAVRDFTQLIDLRLPERDGIHGSPIFSNPCVIGVAKHVLRIFHMTTCGAAMCPILILRNQGVGKTPNELINWVKRGDATCR
jgi:hypothetical protein